MCDDDPNTEYREIYPWFMLHPYLSHLVGTIVGLNLLIIMWHALYSVFVFERWDCATACCLCLPSLSFCDLDQDSWMKDESADMAEAIRLIAEV